MRSETGQAGLAGQMRRGRTFGAKVRCAEESKEWQWQMAIDLSKTGHQSLGITRLNRRISAWRPLPECLIPVLRLLPVLHSQQVNSIRLSPQFLLLLRVSSTVDGVE